MNTISKKVETRGRKKLTQEQINQKIELKAILKAQKKLNKGSIKDIEYNPWDKTEFAPGCVIDNTGKEQRLIFH